jgi:type II secretory pathway pseudopilin PulG
VLLFRFLKQLSNNNHNDRENAFSYISALIFVTVIGISLTAGSTYWSTIVKREKEKELLFRGDQIRRAIESYYQGAPGGGGTQYPNSLKDLLKDPRYLTTRRYLRKNYADPMTKDGQWGLITAPGGKIKGIFSKSKEKPLKVGNFQEDYKNFEKAVKYSDWKFVYPIEKEAGASSIPASGKTIEEESARSVDEEKFVREEELEQEDLEP